jgi:voltage-gated potassium channel Kch
MIMSIFKNWKQHLSYWFDNTLAKGPLVLIGWLALITLALVVLATVVALFFRVQPVDSGLKEVFWDFLFQALTPNPFDVTAPGLFLVIMLIITLASLLMVSILIGILTAGIENRLDAMRRGHSKVLENDHTIILGWSHQIFTIISELVIANENRKHGAVIAILADQDKVEMEDALRERVPNLKNTRVICRSGAPMDLDDLEIISPHTARSIIILPPEENDPDSYVIKTILALVNNPNRRVKPYHIVTQIANEHNLDVVRLLETQDDIHALLMGDQIARIVAQTSRQSGLSVVYTELLNFSGDEIYFQAEPKLTGKTYGEALAAYEDSAVIGLRLANSAIRLNPPSDTQISNGDQIIAISSDDDTVRLSNLTNIPLALDVIRPAHAAHSLMPEKGLILGWNSKAPLIIEELDNYVAPGSELLVVAEKNMAEDIQAKSEPYKNQRVVFQQGDGSDRRVLNRLNVASFQHIIVLAYEDLDVQAADAETMVTLLHLRDILGNKGVQCAIVSEMLDLRNRRLAEVTRVDDFIVSDHLISLMLAQLSENGELYLVFSELFDSIGPEFYLKSVTDYVDIRKPISFYTLLEAARQRGETAVGYRIMSEMSNAAKSYGVHTNPKKSEMVAFSAEDKVVVLAENQQLQGDK